MSVYQTSFVSVSENLPATAYVKMIEVWLIFILLKPFLDIILQTYIETLETRKHNSIQSSAKGPWVEVEDHANK